VLSLQAWRSVCLTPPALPARCARCAVTGQTVYVDNGLSIMGLAMDSKTLERSA
jgi:hypothetical protein